MKNTPWLIKGLPLVAAALTPVASAMASTLSNRSRSPAPLVVSHTPQTASQQQQDLASFGAFSAAEFVAPEAAPQPKAKVSPAAELRSLSSRQLEKLLQKNTQSGASQGLFSGIQAVGGTEELIRTVGTCSFNSCTSNTAQHCNVPSDCGTPPPPPPSSQTITFTNPGTQNFGTSPTLTATASSGLLVSFSSATTGVCTITSGGTLTFVTIGSCTINANQAGNGTYSAAAQVQRSFTVAAVVPGAPTVGTATAGNTQASVTFSAPASNGGASISSYMVTSSPGGLTGTGASSPITVTGLTNGTAYTFTITATNTAGTGSASAASNSVTPAAPQTITFTQPSTQNFGTTPTLTATSDSGLTPTFTSSTTGVCTITSGGALTFGSTGTCTINADQAGNSSYLAASQVSRSFTVNAVVPGAPTIGVATAGDASASVAFSAPASNGGASISSYTVTSNPGGLTGTGASSPITVTGLTNGTAYTFTVTATNTAGTGSASGASSSVTPAAAQTITFANPGAQNFGTTPTLTATSDSGLTPTFTSSTTGVCTITSGGALTFVSTGPCTINADQAGNSSFLAASQVSRSFTVNAVMPAAPTIGTATPGDTQASVVFTAPANTGGASITGYTVTSNPGGLTGSGASSPITVTGLTNGVAYTFSVTATNSAGTGSASAASNSTTPAASQTITFANPGAQNFGTTPTLTATADSSLTPTFTSATTGVCTITSGGALTFVAAGTCTINADQAGNSSFLAATQVSRSFTVNAVAPGAPTIGVATAGNASASVAFSAPASNGGASISAYTVTSNPGGLTGTGTSSPITVTGLTNGTAYTFTVTATNTAGTGSASGASNTVRPAAPLTAQTITFTNPGTKKVGDSFTVTASATSGLTPVFSSATDGVCSVTSDGVVTVRAIGTCTLVASQSGDGSFSSAPSVTQSFAVVSANTAPSISGAPATKVDLGNSYSFTPTATDAEHDPLTFSISGQPAWVTFDSATGALTGTPTKADVGTVDNIVISVTDGKLSTNLPAFSITVGTPTPVITAPADIELNATGLSTQLTLAKLLGLPETATQADIDQQLKSLASDSVKGADCCTVTLDELDKDNTVWLKPGRQKLHWKATNAAGVTSEAIQNVVIWPMVSFGGGVMDTAFGSTVHINVVTNGPAPDDFQVNVGPANGTTLTRDSYDYTPAMLTIHQGTERSDDITVNFPVLLNNDGDLVLQIASSAKGNIGPTKQYVIHAHKSNVAPTVKLQLYQNNVLTTDVDPNGGQVTAYAEPNDLNLGDIPSLSWSGTDQALVDIDDGIPFTFVFDPKQVPANTYTMQVTVTDSGGATGFALINFKIAAPDGADNTDANQNGIPDRLEPNGLSDNTIPSGGASQTQSFIAETEPGLNLALGKEAKRSGTNSMFIPTNELPPTITEDQQATANGGVIDFNISGVAPGGNVKIVIPLTSPIPANAVYRKYHQGAWMTFVENGNNQVDSVLGSSGYCPSLDSTEWTPGLTEGANCIRLTLEDGGPNDDDASANGTILDPGAVSVMKAVVTPPEPPQPPQTTTPKRGGLISGLWLLLLGGLLFFRRQR